MALQILLAISLSLRGTSVIMVMVFLTVSIAVARLAIVATSGSADLEQNTGAAADSAPGEIAFELLTAVEPFFATIVSCLPELRAWTRSSTRGRRQHHRFPVKSTTATALTTTEAA